jgi:hypothetical protein
MKNSQLINLQLYLLFLTFLILKLTHAINWSWILVTTPLWIPIPIIVVLVIIYAILKAIAAGDKK